MSMIVGGSFSMLTGGGSDDLIALHDVLAGGLGTTGITDQGGVSGWTIVWVYKDAPSAPVGREAAQWVNDDDNASSPCQATNSLHRDSTRALTFSQCLLEQRGPCSK